MTPLSIRAAREADHAAITRIILPVIRAGETSALDPAMSEADALSYWLAPDRETFAAEEDDVVVGTSYLRTNQPGGGAHVANCAFMSAQDATGRGIARRLCEHALARARERGFAAMQFNFVVASNARAVRLWRSLDFDVVGRLPGAFRHPSLGEVNALVMFRRL